MNKEQDFEVGLQPPAGAGPVPACGTADCIDCLLNRLAAGDAESEGERCAACGKSVADLDRQVVSLGSHLSASDAAYRVEAASWSLIEQQILSGAPSVVDAPPPAKIGPYHIGRLLGRGGMGAVYQATHRHLRKLVAIKLLPREAIGNASAVSRFEREMEAVGKLDHPHVVRAMDAGIVGDHHFLIMEWVTGTDLSQLVAGGDSLTVADACELVRQAALGLQYAHQQGLIHRDVKPANLMLSVDTNGKPTVKVTDLGLALLSECDSTDALTDQGQLMGTLEFMAPEQAIDTSQVDHRADIYATGATLFRLLTGRVPFDGERYGTPLKRLHALATDSAPSLASRRSGLPPDLVDLVDCMLSRDPADRPQTMQEVADRLRPHASGHQLNQLCHQVGLPEPRQSDSVGLESPVGEDFILADDTSPNSVVTIPEQAVPRAGNAARNGGRDDTPANDRVPPRRISRFWLTCAGAPLLALLAGVVWLGTTDGGYVRIEADPSIEVSVSVVRDGETIDEIQVGRAEDEIWCRSGRYEIRLPADAEDDLSIVGNEFKLSRGEDHLVQISRVVKGERESGPGKSAAPNPASGKRIHLVNQTSDQGDGSLRAAVKAAKSGDTIRFDTQLAGQTIVLTSGQIKIEKDLAIDAGELVAPVTVNAGGLSRVFQCAAECRIDLTGLIVTGGAATDVPREGGGILNSAELRLNNVQIRGNFAADNGGGIKVSKPGRLTMVNCTVAENRAPVGAGVYSANVHYALRNCTISGNTASREAAGIFQAGGDCVIVNSTLAHNEAPQGTAILLVQAGNAVLRNVTIAGNAPVTVAPAYAVSLNTASRLTLQNSIIAANGIRRSYDILVSWPSVEITTRGRNVVDNLQSNFGHTLDAEVITGTADHPFDPKLAQLGDYGGQVQTMPPLSGSPLVDTGIPLDSPITVDARGLYRPIDGDHDSEPAIDIGAVEFNPARDKDLPALQRRLPAPETDRVDSRGNARLLQIDHLLVHNEGRDETLQRSACQIIPFVTFSNLASDSAELQQGAADWQQVLERTRDEPADDFVLPDWITDESRIPLPMVGPKQKNIAIEVSEGNCWCSAKFDNSQSLVRLHDDLATPDINETEEVGFLFISRFHTASDSAEFYEFKTLREMDEADGPQPNLDFKPREIYTPWVYSSFGSSLGLACGVGRFTHYLKLEFLDSSPRQQQVDSDAANEPQPAATN